MDTAKKRILVLNNYSITRVLGEIRAGLKPSHHLYGIVELLDSGWNVIIMDPEKNGFWEKIGYLLNKFFFLNLGNIYTQIKAFRRRNEYDIIYAPCQDMTLLLGLLFYLGLFKKPIVAVSHHPFLIGRFLQLRKLYLKPILKGHSIWGCLNTKLALEINSITKTTKAICMHWGPDLKYYRKIAKNPEIKFSGQKPVDLIAIGRTGRDYNTVIKAFNNTTISVEIYCSKEVATVLFSANEYTTNIKIIGLDNAESLKYPEIIALCERSKIMAIPLFYQKTLAGLTSITDAIALGMPMIVTNNAYLEPDIEKQGAGFWIKEGDSEQWRKCTETILSGNNLNAISQASLQLGENHFNSEIYFNELKQLLN